MLMAFIDLPLALSPVVIGLSIVLVWGFRRWFGGWLAEHGIRIIFAMPGMVLATIVACLPFVVREVVPVLREIGAEQEEAAMTLGASPLQTFWRITLPGIRWGVAYGVVLTTARALGEYGAVAVVSGRIQGTAQTLTLFVDERHTAFDQAGAYGAAVVLAVLSPDGPGPDAHPAPRSPSSTSTGADPAGAQAPKVQRVGEPVKSSCSSPKARSGRTAMVAFTSGSRNSTV